MTKRIQSMILRLAALLLALCLLPSFALAEGPAEQDGDWVNFLLVCNEGMNNNGGNAGNTLMVVAMDPVTGEIRLMAFAWDTFVDYEGYDLPQKIDMPYRNNGPEETMKVFDANFGLDIDLYMSLNYMNLASLIDAYGGVDVDITRAERNALNGMVSSKKKNIQAQADMGLLSQLVVELLADEYYLNEYGPDTHLNGLQAVGFGWLQYDSVYNCCERELKVIGNLFQSVGDTIAEKIAFYTDESGLPEALDGRRPINLDAMSDEDIAYLKLQMEPIFQMSYNNLTDEAIVSISTTLARAAYDAARQGENVFAAVQNKVFPLEGQDPYDVVAGAEGHLVDKEANTAAMEQFLYGE